MIKKTKSILLNEYVFSVFTKMISIMLGMIQSILIARYLGAELKGVNAYISSVVSVGSIIITFGIHQAYPYFRQKYGKEKIYNEYLSFCISDLRNDHNANFPMLVAAKSNNNSYSYSWLLKCSSICYTH